MTLLMALVGVGTFAFFAHQYLVTESRLPELLERYRPLGSVMDGSVTRYDTEREYRDLNAAQSHREAPSLRKRAA
ncbi:MULTISPECIES: hypothetical protein [Nocardia]|uniref:hypothetical protein n=1 Tax=Nocardia TaxID=1817 RepID=UPI00189609F8|nr:MULTISPECIES: hypothetical protein [Nocardia]MBF6352451.1 hypothetical protein [Nocardia flavorosea]